MTPLEEFTGLLAQRDASTEFAEREVIRAEYTAALKVAWDAGHTTTRRAFDATRAEKWLGEKLEEFQKPFRDRLTAAADKAKERRDQIQTWLVELAPRIDLTAAPDARSVYAVVDTGRFSTQTNPHHYAEGFAKVLAAEVATAGVTATIETGPHEYRVTVPLDSVRVEALKCRAGLGTKDFLKLCWKHGINPRVILPFPAGLEDKYGIDYFGNDVEPKGGA